ncbi:hypothetical protein c7_L44 [Megavirus courdo7]|uniref:Uncharacterized protein n=1 Tax=Megavirus courdo7 TaxID=1128135 RepID=H2E9N7_9VIRU|nr:hypothetical protein c7_L44 [Megavirus courdo7]
MFSDSEDEKFEDESWGGWFDVGTESELDE